MVQQHGSQPLKYQRILIKLSGEAFQGNHLFGIEAAKLNRIAQEIDTVSKLGVQIALVIGGGNLIRGSELSAGEISRIPADQMGMLATVINGIALRDALDRKSVTCFLMSALGISSVATQYDSNPAKQLLAKGKVGIFVGGTGNPLVTTDTAAALRGIEINADIVLKATKVEGVFNDDPIKNPQAQRFQHLTYDQVINQRLGVMDLTAILMCQEHNLPVRVFNMNKQGALRQIVMGEEVGTLIQADSTLS